jgi:RHS repeat-associated protein
MPNIMDKIVRNTFLLVAILCGLVGNSTVSNAQVPVCVDNSALDPVVIMITPITTTEFQFSYTAVLPPPAQGLPAPSIFAIRWYFGDGNSVTMQPPMSPVNHTYDQNYECTAKTITLEIAYGQKISTACLINKYETLVIGTLNSNTYMISATDVGCGEFDFTYGGGTPLIQPQWNFGDGSFAAGHTSNYTYQANGTYVVSLRDLADPLMCPIYYILNVTSKPILDFSYVIDCSNIVDFSILNFDGVANTYNWTMDGSGVPGTSSTLAHDFGSSGVHTVALTITDGAGCSATRAETLNVGTVSAEFTSNSICETELFSASNIAVGGDTYFWDFDDGTTSNSIFASHGFANVSAPSDYYDVSLTVTSQGGLCTDNYTVMVAVYSAVSSDFSWSVDACQSGDVSIVPVSTTNVGYYTIDFGDQQQTSGAALPALINHNYTTGGIYTVTLNTGNGLCTESTTKTVFVPAIAEAQIVAPSTFICQGSTMDLTAVLSYIDPNTTYTYSWTDHTGAIVGTSAIYTATSDGSYTVTITGTGTCYGTFQASYVLNPLLIPVVTGTVITGVDCANGADGEIELNIDPTSIGTGWFMINGGAPQNDFNPIMTGLQQGLHYFTISQSPDGSTPPIGWPNVPETCPTVITITVPFDGPILSTTSVAAACGGSNGSANLSVSGSGSYTYAWYDNADPDPNALPVSTSQNLTGVPSGVYTVEATNTATGCVSILTNISVGGMGLNVTMANNYLEACVGQTTTATVNAAYSSSGSGYTPNFFYLWTPIGSSQTPPTGPTGPVGPGDWEVTITDATTDCSETLTFTVIELAAITIAFDITDVTCDPGNDGEVEAIVNGGTGAYFYDWGTLSPDDWPSVEDIDMAQTFALTITDDGGCTASASGDILAASGNITIGTITEADCDILVPVTGGSPDYTFQWIEEQMQEIITPDTGVNGFLSSNTSGVLTPVMVTVEVNQSATSPGVTSNLPAGDYTLVVTDANGCSATVAYTVVSNPIVDIPSFEFVWSEELVAEAEEVEEVDFLVREDMAEAAIAIQNSINECVTSQQKQIAKELDENCFDLTTFKDEFGVSYPLNEHHYTLFYYDRAGNLTKTIPPAGVVELDGDQIADVKDFRAGGAPLPVLPTHTKPTMYNYNGIEQVVSSSTVDGGEVRFLYDALKRNRFAQNAQQLADETFAYVKYDELGRSIEGGICSLANVNVAQFEDLNDEQYLELVVDLSGHIDMDASFPPTYDGGGLPNNKQVIRTTYNTSSGVNYYGVAQTYLRNRVSFVTRDEDGDWTTLHDQYSSHYSYDAHGNVEWLVQQAPVLGKNYMSYEYDLVSGNALRVSFNEHRADKIFHRYSYDRDNRITNMETSRNGEIWDNDASYEYYLHGPMKRTEIGEDHIQGLDYTYTTQGWLKGINTPELDPQSDPGADQSVPGTAGLFADDVFGMSLGYFEGDFKHNSSFFDGADDLYTSGTDLYNGNISTWLAQTTTGDVNLDKIHGRLFNYDVLNRLKSSAFAEHDGTELVISVDNAFATNYTYDADGNLTHLNRNDAAGGASVGIMDQLIYNYEVDVNGHAINRLEFVDETSSSLSHGELVDDHTYVYDEIGNLTEDKGLEYFDAEGNGLALYEVIQTIGWNEDGKIREVLKTISDQNGVIQIRQELLRFHYDASGQRVRKESWREYGLGVDPIRQAENHKETFYVRDGRGNPMAIYERTNAEFLSGSTTLQATFTMVEQPLYGTKRVGMVKTATVIGTINYNPGDNIVLNAGSGILHRNELEHWISPANREEILANAAEICDCEINEIHFDPNTGTITPTQGVPFMGTVNQGVAVAEDMNGFLQFTVVIADDYSGHPNVALIYDREGNLMKGSEIIGTVHPEAQPVAVKIPGVNSFYAVFTLDANRKPQYYVVDMSQLGYSSSGQPVGEVMPSNQTLTADNFEYGLHYTGREDLVNGSSLVYHYRYEPAAFNAPPGAIGNTVVLAYQFGSDPFSMPQVIELASLPGLDADGQGELQIARDGQQLAYYNRQQLIAGFAHRQIEVTLLPLTNDGAALSGAPTIQYGSLAGNHGEGNLEWTVDNNVLYSQRGVYLQNGTGTPGTGSDKNTWLQDIASGTALPTSPLGEFEYSEMRRANNDMYYIAAATEPAIQLAEFDQAAYYAADLNLYGPSSEFSWASALPVQVYRAGAPNVDFYYRSVHEKIYELSDHLGNVRATVSDRKLATLLNGNDVELSAYVLSYSDYYPFGMQMPGRNGGEDYRYAFNGMEQDPEVSGDGNSYTTEFRAYDPRLGRWKSLDPLMAQFAHSSPYVGFADDPVLFTDPTGLGPVTNEQLGIDGGGNDCGCPSDKHAGIMMFETAAAAGYIPKGGQPGKLANDNAGDYTITPYYVEDQGGYLLSYYTAGRDVPVGQDGESYFREEWIIAPNQLDEFRERETWVFNTRVGAANAVYGGGFQDYEKEWQLGDVNFDNVTDYYGDQWSNPYKVVAGVHGFVTGVSAINSQKVGLGNHPDGTTYTGLYNTKTGQAYLYKNWHNNNPPPGYLPRNRAHVQFQAHLVNKGLGKRGDFVAFSAKLNNGVVRATGYNSGSVNSTQFGIPDYAAQFAKSIAKGINTRYTGVK